MDMTNNGHEDIQTRDYQTTAVCYAGAGAAMVALEKVADGQYRCPWCGGIVHLCEECRVPSGRPCASHCSTMAHED